MGDGSALITGSLDKTIKMWNMAVSPPEPRSIDVDGEVQHLSIVGSCLMWANSVLPAPAPVPSDAVGVVELLDIATGSRAKCLVSAPAAVTLLIE